MKHIVKLRIISSAALVALVSQPGLPRAWAGVAVAIGQNFTGITDSDFYADPTGAASADYFVEFNSAYFIVHRKTDGAVVREAAWYDFWAQAGVSLPGTSSEATHRVVYDPTVQRWFVVHVVNITGGPPPTFRFLLAVSASADPRGAWNGTWVSAGTNGSYPGPYLSLGLDAQGVYVSQEYFAPNGGSELGCALFCLPKIDLLQVPPVTNHLTFFGVLPVANYGYYSKPAICFDGSAGGDVLATAGGGRPGQDNTNLIAFAVQNAGGPGPATLTSPRTIAVPAYVAPATNALQPDGSEDLRDWSSTFTANVQRLGGTLFAVGVTQVGDRVGVRWYRLDATNSSLLESGTISDATLDLYYPSIAANTNGTVCISFNASGANTFVSSYAAVGHTENGRTAFGALRLLKAGTASYQNLDPSGSNDWGRYSATCVDPADPNMFWTINTYAAGPTTWATQITQLLTSPSPQLSLTTEGGGLQLSWPVTEVPFQLQSATGITDPGAWSPVALAPATNDTTVSVLLPVTNTSAFFRLTQSQ
jgi:hypothetical protein